MADDLWVTASLSDVFTGKENPLTQGAEELSKLKQEADKVILSFDQKAEAAAQGLAVTSRLLDQLNSSGFNVLAMPPKGEEFFSRLANSDNKPNPADFSTGICIFFQAPDIATTVGKYSDLLGIITA